MDVWHRLQELARFGHNAEGGVTRQAFSEPAREAANWLAAEMRGAGLDVTIDAVGNVIGTWRAGSGTAVASGSHYDTVPNGGRYDGALGVIGALCAVEELIAEGMRPARPIAVIGFNAEDWEQSPMLGSLVFCGHVDYELQQRRGVPQIMQAAGYDFSRLDEANALGLLGAFVELHVEQGPLLESEGADIGVVTGVVGSRLYTAHFVGEANHSGTTPLNLRRDALLGAAEAILEIRRLGEANQARTNVGLVDVFPGGRNIVPGRVELGVDVRSVETETLERIEALLPETMSAIAKRHGLGFELETLNRYEARALDAPMQDAVEAIARGMGLKTLRMPSGAGHDARNLSLAGVPSGIVFVPSVGGISHSPKELTTAEQCRTGVAVLKGVLKRLAS